MEYSNDLFRGFVVVASVLVIMSLVASAIGINSVEIEGVSAVILCAVIALGVQWLSWAPASIRQTERFFDITGGVTYLVIIIFSLWEVPIQSLQAPVSYTHLTLPTKA